MFELGELLQRETKRIVREALREVVAERDTAWLNSEQAAGYIGTSRAQIHNLVSQGRLPRHGAKGSGLKFQRGDLDEYLRTRGRRS